MWEKVASRKHKAIKIFPFGPNSDECMLYGTVQYGLKAGGESGLDWAARAHLVRDNGAVKMDLYQVYLVSARASKQMILTVARILVHKVSRQLVAGTPLQLRNSSVVDTESSYIEHCSSTKRPRFVPKSSTSLTLTIIHTSCSRVSTAH